VEFYVNYYSWFNNVQFAEGLLQGLQPQRFVMKKIPQVIDALWTIILSLVPGRVTKEILAPFSIIFFALPFPR